MRILAFLCSLWLWWSTGVHAELYQWTDADGVIHIVDDASKMPEVYREKVTVYRTTQPVVLESRAAPLSPSGRYMEGSQGAFAQKLALDLGLIKHSSEDALGPLGGAGIRPAGGWKVSNRLTVEVLDEIVTAVRRAADSKRIALSADGAADRVRQAAVLFLPSAPSEPDMSLFAQTPEIIIQQAPPAVTEVIYEPYYVPTPVIIADSPRYYRHPRPHRPGDEHVPRLPATWRSRQGQFGSAQLPFDSPSLPFGSSPQPFGSSPQRFDSSPQPFGADRPARIDSSSPR